ncbi:MAG: DMT family transporter [Clostridia bacterium]|nr:DMT family transporter [Clostridia bacterium]
MNKNKSGILLAILAAALYAISTPVSKVLLEFIPSTLLAGLLYLGAGVGMGILGAGLTLAKKRQDEKRLDRSDLPYTVGMIVLDIAAPILLLLGLTTATAENVSLLNNFEIVATALIALLFFGEKISPRLRWAIGLITLASAILSFENIAALDFSLGSLFVLLAAVCWGLENNCTRRLSEKDPLQIVVVKGLCSGAGSLIIGFALGQRAYDALAIFGALLLGFVAYGLSIFVYVYAQRHIGAAKTSAYYAIAPFIASALSLLIFRDMPNITFFIAAVVMAVGSYLAAKE